MTTRTGEPAAGSLALKKFRIKKCGHKLYFSTEVTFTCQLERHTPDVPHQEVGYVMMANSTARRYMTEWTDEGVAAMRLAKTGKVRRASGDNHTA